jgi:hypothetical protein
LGARRTRAAIKGGHVAAHGGGVNVAFDGEGLATGRGGNEFTISA